MTTHRETNDSKKNPTISRYKSDRYSITEIHKKNRPAYVYKIFRRGFICTYIIVTDCGDQSSCPVYLDSRARIAPGFPSMHLHMCTGLAVDKII